MKNHIRVNGQLFQTTKKGSYLKEKQKNWFLKMAKYEHDRFVWEREKLPVHGSKQQLNECIYTQIEA